MWPKYSTDPVSSSVYILDIDTGIEKDIGGTGPRHGGPPYISGRHVVWSIWWSCDVSGPDKPEDTGLYMYDIETGITTKITDYVEPIALMGDGVVIVTERCFAISRLYAAFLE